AFINVTRELLVRELVGILPPERTVLEVLEDVTPDREVLAACRNLRSRGYRIALDDFRLDRTTAAYLPTADIVKLHVLPSSPHERRRLGRHLVGTNVTLIAEKVETREMFEEARALGYGLFQGYFFARPVTMAMRDIPVSKLTHLRLLKELHRPDLDFGALES